MAVNSVSPGPNLAGGGQGDVEIALDTTQNVTFGGASVARAITPASDANNTQIPNTAWVRARINESGGTGPGGDVLASNVTVSPSVLSQTDVQSALGALAEAVIEEPSFVQRNFVISQQPRWNPNVTGLRGIWFQSPYDIRITRVGRPVNMAVEGSGQTTMRLVNEAGTTLASTTFSHAPGGQQWTLIAGDAPLPTVTMNWGDLDPPWQAQAGVRYAIMITGTGAPQQIMSAQAGTTVSPDFTAWGSALAAAVGEAPTLTNGIAQGAYTGSADFVYTRPTTEGEGTFLLLSGGHMVDLALGGEPLHMADTRTSTSTPGAPLLIEVRNRGRGILIDNYRGIGIIIENREAADLINPNGIYIRHTISPGVGTNIHDHIGPGHWVHCYANFVRPTETVPASATGYVASQYNTYFGAATSPRSVGFMGRNAGPGTNFQALGRPAEADPVGFQAGFSGLLLELRNDNAPNGAYLQIHDGTTTHVHIAGDGTITLSEVAAQSLADALSSHIQPQMIAAAAARIRRQPPPPPPPPDIVDPGGPEPLPPDYDWHNPPPP